MDFDYHDWVGYRDNDPLWCHSAARFKFTKLLQRQSHVFDRAHFTVSVDPMRVVRVPNTMNGKTGLVCSYIGTVRDLENMTIPEILEVSKVFPVQSHLEALDSSSVGSNGLMKPCAKNLGEAA